MDFFYPPELPITSYRKELIETLQHNRAVIVAGETGSGKTTQLPKVCLEAVPEITGMIGCTQPRRVAALALSNRLQEELGDQGQMVGCKIRFLDRTDDQTRIKFMTDGVLLAESRNDPYLKKYSIIIIDEAHERSLNIDFLLGYLKQLLHTRNDLRLVITSATIDTTVFSAHFNGAPIIHIEGKTYPVEIKYHPPADRTGSFVDHSIAVTDHVVQQYPPGDILIFLPTERDILSCCKVLNGRLKHHRIIPLYGKLDHTAQQAIFKPHHQTKIVVATNVAETAITVPGIRYVIDSGLARISKYHPQSRIYKLPIDFISQASSNQRAGRCGRVAPGICFRLYAEKEFTTREPFSTPEIKRSNLAAVILQMIYLRLGDPLAFPFLEPPSPSTIREGYRTLRELGAITGSHQLTAHGQLMAALPIDPVIARIILAANSNQCLREILIISSALAIQDPRLRPAEKKPAYTQAHKKFFHPQSEFLMFLNMWKAVHPAQKRISRSALKKFCKTHFLCLQRMREWFDLHDQLKAILKQKITLHFNHDSASYETIHTTLLTGMFNQCGKRIKKNLFQGGGNREIMIFPASAQYNRTGDWILSGSFLETSRLYALTVATIEPAWLENVAKNYCSYSWQNIRWQQKNGCVMADENVHLYGLPIISKRVVNYPRAAAKNRAKARPIFIRHGLVEAHLDRQLTFLAHNLALIKKWHGAEEKLRKRNIVVDDQTIFRFYDQVLPDQVFDLWSLNKYLKKHGDKALFLTKENILLRTPEATELIDFPTTLEISGVTIALEYNFDPSSENDGITAFIPIDIIELINPDHFDWLVPGLLEEKTTFLLKSLPKSQRKKLIPIKNTVTRVLDQMNHYQGNYYQALSATIARLNNVSIGRSQWSIAALPAHLKMSYVLLDHASNNILTTRNFSDLTEADRPANSSSHLKPAKEHQKLLDSIKQKTFNTWQFDHLPMEIPLYNTTGIVGGKLFFSLTPTPEKQGVLVNYLDSPKRSAQNSARGILYLTKLHYQALFKQFKKDAKLALSGPSGQWLLQRTGTLGQVIDTLFFSIIKNITTYNLSQLSNSDDFSAYLKEIKEHGVLATAQQSLDLLSGVLIKRTDLEQLIFKRSKQISGKSKAHTAMYQHLAEELELLFPDSFAASISMEKLTDTLRYLKSLEIRVNRAHAYPLKDMKKLDSIAVHLRRLEALRNRAQLSETCVEHLQHYQQMIQEMKVSLFSPEIKTKMVVSEKKLTALWRTTSLHC